MCQTLALALQNYAIHYSMCQTLALALQNYSIHYSICYSATGEAAESVHHQDSFALAESSYTEKSFAK